MVKRITAALTLVIAAGVGLLYTRTLTAADTDFPIYFETSTLPLKSQTFDRTTYLPLLEIVRHLNLTYTEPNPDAITIDGANARLTMAVGSASLSVNEDEVLLQNPIRRENNQWLVPLDFLSQGLAKVTGLEFRYKPGDPRVFVGNVSPAELTVGVQSQAVTTRVLLRAGSSIDVELQQDLAQHQAVLVLKGRPVDPARERIDVKDRLVQSIAFDDADGNPRLVINTTDNVRDIRITASDEKRAYVVDLTGEFANPAPGTSAALPDASAGNATRPLSAGNIRVVVIDPGHGGIDHGASNADVLEKDLTLALARRLRTALQMRLSTSVVLTRDSDVELSSEARTEIANNNQAGLFVSLHIGYSPNQADTGASIFVMKPNFSGGLPPDPEGDRLFLPWYMAYRASSPASQAFARELQTDLNQVKPEWKFALRSGPIGVLASLTMTAVAIEVGNLNDQTSLATLNDPAFQARFSTAIANAVSRFGQGRGGNP